MCVRVRCTVCPTCLNPGALPTSRIAYPSMVCVCLRHPSRLPSSNLPAPPHAAPPAASMSYGGGAANDSAWVPFWRCGGNRRQRGGLLAVAPEPAAGLSSPRQRCSNHHPNHAVWWGWWRSGILRSCPARKSAEGGRSLASGVLDYFCSAVLIVVHVTPRNKL